MSKRLNPLEKQERLDFILQRLKRGFSSREVQQQFCKHFQVTRETFRAWLNKTYSLLADCDSADERKRSQRIIAEMYHDQIVSFQNEILGMQKEIERVEEVLKRRDELLARLEKANVLTSKAIVQQLQALPEIGITTKANLIEMKTRIRERMFKVMTELARIRGVGIPTSDWRSALNTLLDNNLIPPQLADAILKQIENFEAQIRFLDGCLELPGGETTLD